MKNVAGTIIKTIGLITIGLGIIISFVMLAFISNEFDSDFGFLASLITFAITFISGIVFVGFGEIILLLQDVANNTYNVNKTVINNGLLKVDFSDKNDVVFGEFNGVKLHWKVIKSNGSSVAIICKNVLGYSYFSKNDVKWENSAMRNWLNGEFYNKAFSIEEKNIINISHNKNNEDISNYEKNTDDKVFLLSVSAIEKYLPDETSRICNDLKGNEAAWWTRTTGVNNGCVCSVEKNGQINNYGQNVSLSCGVRPVISVKKV